MPRVYPPSQLPPPYSAAVRFHVTHTRSNPVEIRGPRPQHIGNQPAASDRPASYPGAGRFISAVKPTLVSLRSGSSFAVAEPRPDYDQTLTFAVGASFVDHNGVEEARLVRQHDGGRQAVEVDPPRTPEEKLARRIEKMEAEQTKAKALLDQLSSEAPRKVSKGERISFWEAALTYLPTKAILNADEFAATKEQAAAAVVHGTLHALQVSNALPAPEAPVVPSLRKLYAVIEAAN